MRRAILAHLPLSLKQSFRSRLVRLLADIYPKQASFSSCGEDRLLYYLFRSYRCGFFVDVGAFHPVEQNNTYLFYRLGWRGINIEPRPGSAALFNQVRPKDTNLEVAIASQRGSVPYYSLKRGLETMNSMSRDFLAAFGVENEIAETIQIPTERLRDVFEIHLHAGQSIQFLSVDVEGMELDVLQSNDWNRFRPQVVLIEDYSPGFETLGALDSVIFLRTEGYKPFCKTPNGIILIEGSARLHPTNTLL